MLRVMVDVVPWGRDYQKHRIVTLEVYRHNGHAEDFGVFRDKYSSRYAVDLIEEDGTVHRQVAAFRLHRYGWHRNRAGLAARALQEVQALRDEGLYRPDLGQWGEGADYVPEHEIFTPSN